MKKDELWDKMIESFEIAGYREVKNEDVESESQAPMQETPCGGARRDTYVSGCSPKRKIN